MNVYETKAIYLATCCNTLLITIKYFVHITMNTDDALCIFMVPVFCLFWCISFFPSISQHTLCNTYNPNTGWLVESNHIKGLLRFSKMYKKYPPIQNY